MITALLFAAAAAVAFWPAQKVASSMFEAKPDAPAPEPVPVCPPSAARRPAFRPAIDSLAYVRSRLVATDSLDEKAKAAIDALTLALVAGSDQE
ncbi:MAG: hypothetical protein EBZ59_05660 [Planctomycetia bacterium]|nr:hypothetical protein [Planctomycetia bacterium]